MSQNFEQFDFVNNQSFQEYLKNIYPPPDSSSINNLQRKWYHKNVDPQFEYINPEQPKNQTSSNTYKDNTEIKQQPQRLPILYQIEGLLKVIYFPCLGLNFISGYVNILNSGALLICILAIFRMVGKPQLNQTYLMKLLPNEFVGNILYIFSLFGGKGSLVYQMPIMLHFMVGACEFWIRLNGPGSSSSIIQSIRQNRNIIVLSKQKIEVYLFLYSIIGIFLGTSTIIQTIVLFQVLTLKSKTNQNMQYAQSQIKQYYQQHLVQNQQIPVTLRNAFGLIWRGYEKVMNAF